MPNMLTGNTHCEEKDYIGIDMYRKKKKME